MKHRRQDKPRRSVERKPPSKRSDSVCSGKQRALQRKQQLSRESDGIKLKKGAELSWKHRHEQRKRRRKQIQTRAPDGTRDEPSKHQKQERQSKMESTEHVMNIVKAQQP